MSGDCIPAHAGQPALSVVLLVDRERQRAARCLAGLLAQTILDQLEVLLVDLGADRLGPLSGSEHPRVRVLQPPPTSSFGELQAQGVLAARAPIVAFIEEHCIAAPTWAAALVLAHRAPVAAVGGQRENATPQRSLARFLYLLDALPGPLLPAGNVTYKRDVLLRYGERLAALFESEGLLQARLLEDGFRLAADPAVRYEHEYDESWPDVCVRWYWQGYAAGAARAHLKDSPRGARRMASGLWRLLKGAAAPAVLTQRLIRAGSPARWDVLLRNAHLVLLYPFTYVLGDVAGTLRGGRGMDARVRDHLLNGTRISRAA